MRNSRAPWLLAALSGIFLMTGCETMTGSGRTEGPADPTAGPPLVCYAWRPIPWSSTWPDEAIRRVKANNAAWKAWCGTWIDEIALFLSGDAIPFGASLRHESVDPAGNL